MWTNDHICPQGRPNNFDSLLSSQILDNLDNMALSLSQQLLLPHGSSLPSDHCSSPLAPSFHPLYGDRVVRGKKFWKIGVLVRQMIATAALGRLDHPHKRSRQRLLGNRSGQVGENR